jgi:hypothetical protein
LQVGFFAFGQGAADQFHHFAPDATLAPR